MAIQHSLHLRRHPRRRIPTEQPIKIIQTAIIWAIPAIGNLAADGLICLQRQPNGLVRPAFKN
ncbi:MAG: hypothetical protein KGQ48_15085 [Bradyrhizobium sp.]|nr:hypothetical protein [Bradyrhizobium sp.]